MARQERGAMDLHALAEQSSQLVGTNEPLRFNRNLNQVVELASSLCQNTGARNYMRQEAAATRLLAKRGVELREFDASLRAEGGSDEQGALVPSSTSVSTSVLNSQAKSGSLTEFCGNMVDENASFCVAMMQKQEGEHYGRGLRERWQNYYPKLIPSLHRETWRYPVVFRNGRENGVGFGGDPMHGAGMQLDVPNRDWAYVDVVKRMVKSRRAGGGFEAVGDFREAASSVENVERGLVDTWKLLASMIGFVGARSAARTQSGTVRALLRGARKFLEDRNAVYMRETVRENRVVVEAGGDPDRLKEVRAFVLCKHRDVGMLDIQQPNGGQSTDWAQVFYALHVGYVQVALKAAKKTKWLFSGGRMKTLSAYIEEWDSENGSLSAASAQDLSEMCEALLNSGVKEKRSPFFKYKIMTMAFLAGDITIADRLVTFYPNFWDSLEEYLWFMVGIVRTQPYQTPQHLSLQDLQRRLRDYPADHYTKNGTDLFAYIRVLFCSLQFKTALQFLAQDKLAEGYRSDAVHFALAFHFHNVVDAGGDGDMGLTAMGIDVAGLVHSYGRQFVHSDSELALHYYLLAADMKGDSRELKAEVVREILCESRDYGTLLGGGGEDIPRTALHNFVGSPEEIPELIEMAASMCEARAQNEEAVELFMAAGKPTRALGIINTQIAQSLQKYVDETDRQGPQVEVFSNEVERRFGRGQDAKSKLRGDMATKEAKTFIALDVTRKIIVAFYKRNYEGCLDECQQLPWIPSDASKVEAAIKELTSGHNSLVHILPGLLRLIGHALVKHYNANHATVHNPKETILALSSYVKRVPPPFVMGRHVSNDLMAIAASL